MAHDEARIRELARSYTDAWCSHDPTRVADHYVKGGTIAINGGDPTEVTDVARSFIDAFPDIQVSSSKARLTRSRLRSSARIGQETFPHTRAGPLPVNWA